LLIKLGSDVAIVRLRKLIAVDNFISIMSFLLLRVVKPLNQISGWLADFVIDIREQKLMHLIQ
jgi:hypothetical protein